MQKSLLDFIHLTFEQIDSSSMSLGKLFPTLGDSVLTMALLFFISRWIFDICVSLGRKGWK